MVVILLVNLLTNKSVGITGGEWSAWRSAWALIGWGLAAAAHGLVLQLARAARLYLVREEEQIDKALASMDPESQR